MKSMKEERPDVGSNIKVRINNDLPVDMEVVGYFDKTRSVFLYEAPFTPIVREWDDVCWEYEGESAIEEMKEDIKEWVKHDGYCDLTDYLIKQGWRKDND